MQIVFSLLLIMILTVGFFLGLFFYAILCLELWGIGVMQSIQLIINGKILDHHRKSSLKEGQLVLLKTKGGSYPIKIHQNHPAKREISVETDPFMYWKTWSYDDIELINTKIKKLLYGRY